MNDSKAKSFTFWRANYRRVPYSMTAQDLFSSAFFDTDIDERLIDWDEQEKPKYPNFYSFISRWALYRGFFCACFLSCEKDRVEHVFKESDLKKKEVDLTEVPPGDNQQFVDGILHFVCYENDVILAQDRRLLGRHFENFLNALLPKSGRVDFPEDQEIVLNRPPSQNTLEEIQGVKGVNLSANLIKNEYSQGSYILDAIKSFAKGYSSNFFRSATEGFMEERDTRVSMQLRWDRRVKGQSEGSDKVNAFSNPFRHIDEEIDVELLTRSGKWRRYKDFLLSDSTNVLHINGVPDNQDIFDKMINWHIRLRNEGHI